MEMDYWYDWSFVGVPSTSCGSSLTVVNGLRRYFQAEKKRESLARKEAQVPPPEECPAKPTYRERRLSSRRKLSTFSEDIENDSSGNMENV